MNWKKGIDVTLLTVLALFCAGSVVLPGRGTSPEEAVPAWAGFTVRRAHPFGDWQAALHAPLVRSQLMSTGFTEERLEQLPEVAGLSRLLRRVRPAEGVFARVQSPRTGRFFWMFSGTLGLRASGILLQMPFWLPAAAEPAGVHAGHRIWALRSEQLPPNCTLWFSVADGLLAGCLSPAVEDMALVLDSLDGRVPSRASVQKEKEQAL
jgi:hypothetical protein